MHHALSLCHRCRRDVVESFAALAGASLRSLTGQPSLLQAPTRFISRRHFGNTKTSRQVEAAKSEPVHATTTTLPPNTPSSIPWYLQVQTPDLPAPTSPLLALQEIPPLPADAPQILSPILNQLSTQIGLDNLALLDLRDLDPPPALGANLIMIIGTARSYKHLNTSADRFCRWVRSRYKLSPYADGLLGRNELKLKLRRKARKMKLAQSVGNTVAMDSVDDGITTGWICVNIGDIESARIPEDEKMNSEAQTRSELTPVEQEEVQVDEYEYDNPDNAGDGYVGFGSRSTAPRIVVQMFVEEKRLEMDLEGLWDYRNERRTQRAERADAEAKQRLDTMIIEKDEFREQESESTFKPWSQ